MISFDIPKERRAQVKRIIKKAERFGITKREQHIDFFMSVVACIAQGQDLNLERLEDAAPHVLAHDLHGIHYFIDKRDNSPTGGRLLHGFKPMSAA